MSDPSLSIHCRAIERNGLRRRRQTSAALNQARGVNRCVPSRTPATQEIFRPQRRLKIKIVSAASSSSRRRGRSSTSVRIMPSAAAVFVIGGNVLCLTRTMDNNAELAGCSPRTSPSSLNPSSEGSSSPGVDDPRFQVKRPRCGIATVSPNGVTRFCSGMISHPRDTPKGWSGRGGSLLRAGEPRPGPAISYPSSWARYCGPAAVRHRSRDARSHRGRNLCEPGRRGRDRQSSAERSSPSRSSALSPKATCCRCC